MWILHLVVIYLASAGVRGKTDVCPQDLVKETQNCFTSMAQAVQAESNPMAQSGAMTLDYKQIKKYCNEGGLITQFIQCVEDLFSNCQNSTQTAVLERLVSPARVKAAKPVLCQKQDEIENAGDCMNSVMTQDSQCKNQAYDKVKLEMSKSIRNVTMTFLIQCSFFNSLAACQKDALSKTCGGGLGEVHAHFLLSFIPSSCSDNSTMSVEDTNGKLPDKDLGNGEPLQMPPLKKTEITETEFIKTGNPNKTLDINGRFAPGS